MIRRAWARVTLLTRCLEEMEGSGLTADTNGNTCHVVGILGVGRVKPRETCWVRPLECVLYGGDPSGEGQEA